MNKKSIIISVLLLGALASCNSGGTRRNPGKAYAMDMTYSRAYDYYNMYDPTGDSLGVSARLPVQGTIARGHSMPDHMVEGDTNGYKSFTTNMKFNEAEIKEGGRLYNIYCAICHGTNLDGNGPLYAEGNGKFAAKPANLKDAKYVSMDVGTIYAAIKYGKNMMGSYASQLDVKQRWQVIAYIKKSQGAGGDAMVTMGGTAPMAPTGTGGAVPGASTTRDSSRNTQGGSTGASQTMGQ